MNLLHFFSNTFFLWSLQLLIIVRFLQLLIKIYLGTGWLNSFWLHMIWDRVLMVWGNKILKIRITYCKVHISLCCFFSWIKYSKLPALLWARQRLHALQWQLSKQAFLSTRTGGEESDSLFSIVLRTQCCDMW